MRDLGPYSDFQKAICERAAGMKAYHPCRMLQEGEYLALGYVALMICKTRICSMFFACAQYSSTLFKASYLNSAPI